MPKVEVANSSKFLLVFQETEIEKYIFRAVISKINNKPRFLFVMPTIVFAHHDRRVATEIIDGLKQLGKWAAKQTGREIGYGASAQPETIYRMGQQVRIPVYRNFAAPWVQICVREDGHWEWIIQGHRFDDDLPSIRAYVGTIIKLMEYAYENRWV